MAGLPVLKKCRKIQNVVSSSDFEIFYPERLKCMLYMQYVKYDLVLINVRRLFTNERPLKDVCIRLLPDKISHSFLHIPPVLWVRIA